MDLIRLFRCAGVVKVAELDLVVWLCCNSKSASAGLDRFVLLEYKRFVCWTFPDLEFVSVLRSGAQAGLGCFAPLGADMTLWTCWNLRGE